MIKTRQEPEAIRPPAPPRAPSRRRRTLSLALALVLSGLRQKVDGKEVPLTKGRIELQSESAEIFFRRIQLQYILEIPPELLK